MSHGTRPPSESIPQADDTAQTDGLTVTTRISSAATGGHYACTEYLVAPHFHGVAPHWHARTTEWVHVLDGTLAFALDDQTITVARGAVVHVPPRTVHSFWNPAAAAATMLVLYTPAICDPPDVAPDALADTFTPDALADAMPDR